MSPTLKDCRAASIFTVDCIPPPDYDGVTSWRRARAAGRRADRIWSDCVDRPLEPVREGPFSWDGAALQHDGSLTPRAFAGQLACNTNARLSALISFWFFMGAPVSMCARV